MKNMDFHVAWLIFTTQWSRCTCQLMRIPALLLLLFTPLSVAFAEQIPVEVKDDAGRIVKLSQPAKRIISLAPHATELLFAAGAGAAIIGVSDYSNFPEQAKKIFQVGSVFALDIERIVALKPDLVVVWGTGGAKIIAKQLRDQHLVVFESEPRNFETVATSIERLAQLGGTAAVGDKAAAAFRVRLSQIKNTYASERIRPVRVFYQIWHQPLMTLNGQHLVSEMLRLCGAENIFSQLKEISPTVSTEAVIAANPDAIVTTGDVKQDQFAQWRTFTQLTAVKKSQLFVIQDDWMSRPGPRVLDGTEALCKHLSKVN
jgi:iron complex transport system substrate-binding protein